MERVEEENKRGERAYGGLKSWWEHYGVTSKTLDSSSEFRPLRRDINLDGILEADQDLSMFTETQLEDIAETCAASTTAAFNESSIYEG